MIIIQIQSGNSINDFSTPIYVIHSYLVKHDPLSSILALGNWNTLEVTPKAQGLDTRQELLKFYKEKYSANLMHLVAYGRGMCFIRGCFWFGVAIDLANRFISIMGYFREPWWPPKIGWEEIQGCHQYWKKCCSISRSAMHIRASSGIVDCLMVHIRRKRVRWILYSFSSWSSSLFFLPSSSWLSKLSRLKKVTNCVFSGQ